MMVEVDEVERGTEHGEYLGSLERYVSGELFCGGAGPIGGLDTMLALFEKVKIR